MRVAPSMEECAVSPYSMPTKSSTDSGTDRGRAGGTRDSVIEQSKSPSAEAYSLRAGPSARTRLAPGCTDRAWRTVAGPAERATVHGENGADPSDVTPVS